MANSPPAIPSAKSPREIPINFGTDMVIVLPFVCLTIVFGVGAGEGVTVTVSVGCGFGEIVTVRTGPGILIVLSGPGTITVFVGPGTFLITVLTGPGIRSMIVLTGPGIVTVTVGIGTGKETVGNGFGAAVAVYVVFVESPKPAPTENSTINSKITIRFFIVNSV